MWGWGHVIRDAIIPFLPFPKFSYTKIPAPTHFLSCHKHSKLNMLLRGILSQDWVNFLPKVVHQFNHTPQTKLGGIAPEQISSIVDSAKVFDARKKAGVTVFHEPNFKQQIANQERYEKDKSNLQVGDYVYLTLEEKLFDKSFDVKVKKFID